ncbi:MAG: DDE-type integrase/transposase/recombinase [Myxococcota bacterium]|nr:DDE-type integrase/transposase/recombinase [Myxococcota bacterium]
MKRVSRDLKMRVLGAIEYAPGGSIVARIRHVAEQPFTDENGARFQFTWRTIQSWYSRYKKDGITTMHPRSRRDRGVPRKMTVAEITEVVDQARKYFRDGKPRNTTAVYRVCIEHGLVQRAEIAPNTFRRVVKAHGLLSPETPDESKRRLAFAKACSNEMWQADTMVGPYVKAGTGHAQAKLIAFIDDASRVCCHGEFFVAENTETLVHAFKSALYKRGVPQTLYVDNGSIYTSKEISQICVRIGTLLCHAPVRDGAAKGKVERFFRTVRESFLTRALDLTSVDALNRAFSRWVEDEYNGVEHSSILMKPIDRFGLDLPRVRFLPPNQANDELFYVEEDRSVLADNTFSFRRCRFEAPRDLRSRKIQIRFDRRRPERVVVFYKGDRMGDARPVDLVANDRKPRPRNREVAT